MHVLLKKHISKPPIQESTHVRHLRRRLGESATAHCQSPRRSSRWTSMESSFIMSMDILSCCCIKRHQGIHPHSRQTQPEAVGRLPNV